MNRRELNLTIFEGNAEGVLWQPILEQWIRCHMAQGTVPDRLRGMTPVQIYDALGCSARFASDVACNRSQHMYYQGIEQIDDLEGVVRIQEQYEDHSVHRVRTPVGELRTVRQEIWEDGRRVNSRIVDFPVKAVADLRVLTDLVNRQQFCANVQTFERVARMLGDSGYPSIRFTGSGFTDLIKIWCGLPGTYYLLHDHPGAFDPYLEACDRRDERVLEQLLKLPSRIISICDHANNELTPPSILKKYIVPRLRRYADRFHEDGRFLHTHWDGNSRLLLPYLRETHLDGVEALPPLPFGDMTLEQIKDAVGDDIVVLDLLPSIFFLPNYPLQDLLAFTRRVIEMFSPRLILGVSDELSEAAEIERIEAISELVDEICGLPD